MTSTPDLSFDFSTSGEALLNEIGTVARAKWLEACFRHDDIFFFQDGAFSQMLFSEILECFVAGRDIAVIVLGFSFIERTIAGRLVHNGHANVPGLTGEQILDEATKREWISQAEHDNLTEVRRLRNPIVHFKLPQHSGRPETRSLLLARTTREIMEQDAKQVLEAAIRVLSKTSI